MNNDLKILVSASLNIGKSIDEINTQIKGLQRKVNSLKLNIEVNEKILQKLNNFSKQMERLKDNALNTGKVIEEALMPDGTKIKRTFFDGLNGSFQETIKKAQELKTNLESTTQSVTKQTADLAKGYDVLASKVEKFNAQQQKLAETLKYQNETGTRTRTINLDSSGNLKGYTDTQNLKKENELTQQLINGKKQLREELIKLSQTGNVTAKQLAEVARSVNLANDLKSLGLAKQKYEELVDKAKLAEQMAKGREQANLKAMREEIRLAEAQAKAANKALEDAQRQKEKQAEINKEIEYQLKLYQRLTQAQANNLIDRYGDRIDKQALSRELERVMITSPDNFNNMKEFRRWQQEVNTGFKEIALNAKNSANHVGNFVNQLSVAMQRIPIWMVGMTAFYAPLRLFQDAISQIITIDTQLTSLGRVTDEQTNLNQILEESIKLADQLGNKVVEINEGLIEFARQGFDGDELLKITEAATLMANVSDLSVEESASALTSALKGFNLETEQAIHVVDALNEVDLINKSPMSVMT
ncbi:phage tail tape measure protein [Geobacillus thermodenitrificans]|uniref:phage tail tape measure protein n=1 Tax=Geobacillus thermodenitrificans TaxID=33940 RepID=UPI003D1CE10C